MSCEKSKSISDLENLAPTFAALGGIDDIVKISSEFLGSPVENIPVEELLLKDPQKTIGKFKVADLSDAAGLDVTKAIDLKPEDLQDLKSLKFSISVPTVEIVKSLSFGVASVDMKFSITREGFTWLPVVNLGIDSKEKALENLKGVTAKEIVNASNTSLEEAKEIAAKNYKDPQVLKAIESALTIDDFLNQISALGIFLTKEIDVEAEMRKMVENENAVAASLVPEDPFADACGTKDLVPAPFSPEELKEIEKDCCDPEVETPTPNLGVEVLNDFLAEAEMDFALTPEDEAKALNDIEKFVEDLNESNQIIQNCATEKEKALNDYYLYLETLFNNEIALTYAEARANMISALVGDISVLQQQRNSKIQRSLYLKNRENSLFVEAIDRIFPTLNNVGTSGTSGSSPGDPIPEIYVLSIQGRNLTQARLNKIEKDVTFKAAVQTIRDEQNSIENEILNLSSQIENRKQNFTLPTFTAAEIQLFQSLNLTTLPSVLRSKTKFFREKFSLQTNPIAGVGFNQDADELKLRIHPILINEARMLFALNSPEVGDVAEYLVPLISIPPIPTGDGSSTPPITLRTGKVATDVWNKYYSQNRVDNLFSYLEQGYKSPKPIYDDEGNPIGNKTTVTITGPVGDPIEQEVDEALLKLEIDQEIALSFWPNLESKTKEKILLMLSNVKKSPQYVSYISQIKAAAENEAKYAFSVNLIFQENSYTARAFDSYTNTFSFNQATINNSLVVNLNTGNIANQFKNLYIVSYDSIREFQNSIQQKIEEVEAFIETRKECIAAQEDAITEKSNTLAIANATPGTTPGTTPGKAAPEKDCISLLGSDPLGRKSPSDCPGITKNCYWEEYTKLMQLVSLMPIPDVQFLSKRLFRYYPVALQIPVPIPPGALPTLASGIPDPAVSIPLPMIWKHIVTISTPAGLFVVWIALCGPVPGPYVLYFDEKVDPCFLVTPKGPISVPAKSLGIQGDEELALIDFLPIKEFFRLNLGILPFDKLMGSNLIKLSDPDDPSNIISKIQTKIKNAITSLEEVDPDYKVVTGTEEEIKEKRAKLERIRKVFDTFPPDLDVVNEVFKNIEDLIDKTIDSMKISPIKFPKNPKKLMMPVIGPAEFMDSINDLIDAGLDVAEAGLSIRFISLKDKLKKLIDQKLSAPEIKAEFKKINDEIAELENELSLDLSLDAETKIKERIKKVKQAMKKPLEEVAKEITPEMLGFVAAISIPIPLPVPCYDDVTIAPVPPYVLAILAAIQALPSLVDAIPDDTLADQLSKFVNLSVPLPDIEDIIYFAFKAFSSFLPDLSYPDPESANLVKENIKTAVQNFTKIKIRPPKPGAIQITITESMIKGIIKGAVKAAFAAITGLIISEITKAIENNDLQGIIAVIGIVKAIFGTDLGSLSGADVKAMLVSFLEAINQDLESLNTVLSSIQVPAVDFKSIKETLFPTFPPKIFNDGPYLEFGTKELLAIAEPLLSVLSAVPLPFPLVLLGCTLPPSRLVLSKIYPFSAKEPLPSWEKLSLSNVPYVIFLDQLIATAQRQGGIGSDYVLPYYLPDA